MLCTFSTLVDGRFKCGVSQEYPTLVPEVLAFNEELSPGVGSRLKRLRPKAEDTSGEAARKNLWRRAP